MVFRPGKSGSSLAVLLATISCCSGNEIARTCQQLKDRVTPVDRGGPSLITTTLGEGEALSCLEGVTLSPGIEIRAIGATAGGEEDRNAGLRAAARTFTLPRQQRQETWRRAPSEWHQDETDLWVEEEERRLQEDGYETPITGEGGEEGGGGMLGEDEQEATAPTTTTNSTAVADEGDGAAVASGEGDGDAGEATGGVSSSNITASGSSNSTASSSSSNSTEVGSSGGGNAVVNTTSSNTPAPAATAVAATPVPAVGSNDTSEGTFPLEETRTEPPAHVSTEPPAGNSSTADGAFPLEEPSTEPPANVPAAGATDAPVGGDEGLVPEESGNSTATADTSMGSGGEGGEAWGEEGGSDEVTSYEEEYEEEMEEYEEEYEEEIEEYEEEYEEEMEEYEEEYEEEMEEYEEEYEEMEEEYEEYEEEMEEEEEVKMFFFFFVWSCKTTTSCLSLRFLSGCVAGKQKSLAENMDRLSKRAHSSVLCWRTSISALTVRLFLVYAVESMPVFLRLPGVSGAKGPDIGM
ncbi:unnamed protein product, partial [Ectocarpus sp. 12 AP-2014]